MAGKTKYRDGDVRWRWLDERGIHVQGDPLQYAYMESLWANPDEIQGIFCNADAGTGKTVLAVLAAYYDTVELGNYKQIIYVRNTQVVGEDVGFLPGDIDEKVGPHMRPIKAALDLVKPGMFEQMIADETLICKSPTHDRGVTHDSSYIILDEVQNYSLAELQTEHTRVTSNSKVVSIGSTKQIDNEKLRKYGGLTPFEIYTIHYRGLLSVEHTLETNYRGPWSQHGDKIKETIAKLESGEITV